MHTGVCARAHFLVMFSQCDYFAVWLFGYRLMMMMIGNRFHRNPVSITMVFLSCAFNSRPLAWLSKVKRTKSNWCEKDEKERTYIHHCVTAFLWLNWIELKWIWLHQSKCVGFSIDCLVLELFAISLFAKWVNAWDNASIWQITEKTPHGCILRRLRVL